MNRIQRNKLHHTKWTAAHPENHEKHFLVTRVVDDVDEPLRVVLEAVHSKREYVYPWTDLKDDTVWLQGWRS